MATADAIIASWRAKITLMATKRNTARPGTLGTYVIRNVKGEFTYEHVPNQHIKRVQKAGIKVVSRDSLRKVRIVVSKDGVSKVSVKVASGASLKGLRKASVKSYVTRDATSGQFTDVQTYRKTHSEDAQAIDEGVRRFSKALKRLADK